MLAEDFDVVMAADGIAALDTVPLGGIDLPVLESPKLVPAEHGR